jgi:hypothetical protein
MPRHSPYSVMSEVGVKRQGAILRRTIQHSNDNQYLRMYASYDAERASGGIGESVIETEIIRTEDSY